MQLSSTKNPRLQEIRKAAAAGTTTSAGLMVAEGPHLLEEAIASPWAIETIVAATEARLRFSNILSSVDAELIEVPGRVFESIAATEHSQGVLALLRRPEIDWPDLFAGRALLVVLDGIQDPGNAGTIVRSAEAFGATGVVCLKGSARLANGKFLRASAGSVFRVPCLEDVSAELLLRMLRTEDLPVYALSASGATALGEIDLRRRCVLVVGNEGAGVSTSIAGNATEVRVPTGAVESLNAGVACSIALYEASRQRNGL